MAVIWSNTVPVVAFCVTWVPLAPMVRYSPTENAFQLPPSVRVMVVVPKFTVAAIVAPPRYCTSVRSAAASAVCCAWVKTTGDCETLIEIVPPFWPTAPWVISVTLLATMLGALVVTTVLVTSFISPALNSDIS